MSDNSLSQRAQYQSDGSGKSNERDEIRTANILKWHPDYSMSSPQAREWHKKNQESRSQPLNLNGDGTYTVQGHDALSTIAERDLHRHGQRATKTAIASEIEQIIALNKDKYPTLDRQKEYLGNGWRLRLPDAAPSGPNCVEGQRPSQPVPRLDYGMDTQPKTYPIARSNDDYRYQQYQQPQDNSAALVAGMAMLPIAIGAAQMFNRQDYGRSDYYRHSPRTHWQDERREHMWHERRRHHAHGPYRYGY